MKLIVNPHKIEIVKELVNEKEIDITKCEFEFSEEITDDFVKEAYFTLNNDTYKQIIENNECKIPYEVLKEKGQVEIGCVAFLVENEQEIKRYNPSPVYISTLVGSLKEDFENSEPITPTDKEQIEQMLNNINVDANIEGKITTITITFKDGTTKDVTLEDGMGIDYNWVGTQLGIKREDEQEYEYVDLKGEKGDAGAIRMRIVQELPFVGDEDTMYLVPLEEPETEDNRYAEYIYVNNQWELLGKIGIQVDLSDYYTKSQVYNKEETDTKVNAKYTKPSDGIPKEDLTQSVQTSLDKADSSIQDVSGKEDKSNKVTSLSSSSTNTQYPSAKCVYDSQETQNNDIQDLQEENNELKGIINNIYDIDNYLINNHSIESEETTESITLNNTMNKAPMSLTLKGNIEQDSTTGKNLAQRIGGYLTADGTFKTSNDDSFYFPVVEGETYTYNAIGNRTLGAIYDNVPSNNATPISGTYSNNMVKNTPFTASATGIMVIYANTPTSQDTINSFIVVKGNEIGDYEPYTGNTPSPSPSYPQDIHIVSGDNEIKVCNKNLFNIPNNTGTKGHNTFVASNQEITINSDSSGTESAFYLNDVSQTSVYAAPNYPTAKDYKMTSMGGTYTLTTYFSYKPQNTTQIYLFTNKRGIMKNVTIDWQNGKLTHNITLEDDEYIKSIQCYCAVTNVYNNLKITAQLEKGSTATDYVEHKEYTKEINLGELEVGGIGEYEDEFFKNTIDSDYYDSTLELDKWYLKKKIKKVVYTGANSENWYGNGQNDNYGQFYISTTDKEYGQLLLLSNYFIVGTSANGNYIRGGTSNSNIYITIAKSIVSYDITSFKEWLNTHNTIVYYVLATPENILLNDTLQETLDSFVSYQEQTNISQTNNDLPFVIKARAIKEIL